MRKQYLLDEYPLLVLPSLAVNVGLNKAIVLQQAHYWLQKSTKSMKGRTWFHKTYEEWQEEFPFWSISTIRRAISELEKEELLLVDNFNQKGYDKTKWYSVNYPKLEKSVNSPCVQNEQSICSERTDACVQNEQIDVFNMNKPIPDITTTTTITTKKEDDVDKLGNRFIELRAKGVMLKALDYQSIARVLKAVPLEQAIQLLEAFFLERKGKTTIHSFSYCEKYIIEQYDTIIARQDAQRERGEHEQYSRRNGKVDGEKSTSSQANAGVRRTEKQYLVGEDGQIPDSEYDF
ncbi:hypothetical protein [Alkalihalobacillus pseudalcaliphilus]|uniref:hypothetical protein n=1 Tax=Alkalihalobacillus pseudalcaliphilus TaxID=79884 RepID=UPI00069F2D92|nr:hypothetical protein [Alkalihalobacillus pseudalcaliphilus]